ncbi:MAG: hypothetical protein ABIG37_01270 [Nanoarchaeota archaeon]|nr:hypothetical protein [Nanoarchaeota archaeon]MBU1136357.1 hypothetical protein [Nanoarchaeota archaeon]
MKLQEILDSNYPVLVDTSISETKGQKSIAKEIHKTRHYSDINPGMLTRKFSDIDLLATILQHPSSFTIPEITAELKRLEEIICDKIKFCGKKDYSNVRRSNKRNKRIRRREAETSDTSEQLLKEFQRRTFQLTRLSKQSEIQYEESLRAPLLGIVELIENEIGLKENVGLLHRGGYSTENQEDLHTDEKLISTLYYLSMFQNKKPVLLTQDSDFVRLLAVVSRLVSSNDLLPLNTKFRDSLYKNPIKLYYKQGQDYEIGLSSDEIAFDPEFLIFGTSELRNQEIKSEIKRYLQNLKNISRN